MDGRSIDLPVREVRVLEDRAVVTRQGRVELPKGSHALIVEAVAPTMVDKSLCVRVTGQARVVQSRLQRVVTSARGDQTDRVAEWITLELDRRRALEDAERGHEIAQESTAALREAQDLLLAEIAEDVALGREVAPRLETLGSLRGELDAAIDVEVERGRARVRARAAHRDAQRMLAEIRHERRSVEARLELHVHSGGGESVEFTVRYAVAGALWRPSHVATLHEDGRVEVESQACVWQATGEDWAQAQLSFSTERPSLGTDPPKLATDVLSLQVKAPALQVQARDQVIATTGEGARQLRDEMPGVDDGGEPLTLRSDGPRTVVSNGRPHRVPLFAFTSEAQAELLCRPEKVAAVLLRTTSDHRGPHPLLAGPVELRRHGGFVGRSSTLFVAPGERFEIGWGPDPDLRVHRKVEHGEHTRRPLSAWVRKPRSVEVTISNLGPQPRSVRMQERVMVSEIDKVEVELDDLGGGAIDDDGILARTIDVRGFGESTFRCAWTVVVHDDVSGV